MNKTKDLLCLNSCWGLNPESSVHRWTTASSAGNLEVFLLFFVCFCTLTAQHLPLEMLNVWARFLSVVLNQSPGSSIAYGKQRQLCLSLSDGPGMCAEDLGTRALQEGPLMGMLVGSGGGWSPERAFLWTCERVSMALVLYLTVELLFRPCMFNMFKSKKTHKQKTSKWDSTMFHFEEMF